MHNEGKDGRANFKDIVMFESIHTDKNGSAEVTMTMPDNITGWRFIARAYTPVEMRAGQNSKILSTSLPFFANVVLNEHYRTGDRPKLMIRIGGKQYQNNQPVQYKVNSDTFNLNVQGVMEESVAWVELGALPVGAHKITIEVSQGSLSDKVQRKIEIADSYAVRTKIDKMEVKEGTKLVVNQNGLTNLLLLDAGRGRYVKALLDQSQIDNNVRADDVAASYLAGNLLRKEYNQNLAEESLDLSAYIQTDEIQNFSTQESAKGVALLPYGSADLELTAKLADAAGQQLPGQGVKKYLQSQLYNKNADIHRSARALYGLASLGEPVLTKVQLLMNNPELTLTDKVYAALALANSGDKEGARVYYEQKIKVEIDYAGADIILKDKSADELAVLPLLSVLCEKVDHSDAPAVWEYLDRAMPDYTSIRLERMMAAEAGLSSGEKASGKLEYVLEGVKKELDFEKETALTLNLTKQQAESFEVENIEGVVLIVQYQTEAVTHPKASNLLAVERLYSANGVATDSLKEGDLVKVKIRADIPASEIEKGYQITDVLPGGLKVARRDIDELASDQGAQDQCEMIWNPLRVKDNVVTFAFNRTSFNADKCAGINIVYYARVVSKGTFNVEPVVLQSLVNADMYVTGKERTLIIE